MTSLAIEEFLDTQCSLQPHTLEEYEGDVPRWCKGCGDHSVLSSVQRLLRDTQQDPENLVAVSGIGCSSRFPHYLRAYGFHGIHGRALPVSLGVALSRPDLKVLTVMGDGDCFSIGAGHWLHTLRYNVDMTVLVLDNEIYALTKKQVSPTSPEGAITNTTPRGAYLRALNPLSLIMGISNVSFLAQTATWLPEHLDDTLRTAWSHRGMAFVRILQRCPVYMPDAFGAGGRSFPGMFLEHAEGIKVSKGMLRNAEVVPHDPHDIHSAQRIALQDSPAPLGLLYQDRDVPTYQEVRRSKVKPVDRAGIVAGLNAQFDKYAVRTEQ